MLHLFFQNNKLRGDVVEHADGNRRVPVNYGETFRQL
jgi:hypothetical protein